MFGELLESRAKPVRNRGGAVVSVVGHAALIGLAVMATRGQLNARRPVERVITLPILHPAPPTPMQAAPARRPISAPSLPSAPNITFPTIVLSGIPPIDLTHPLAPGIEWPSDRPGLSSSTTTYTPSVSGDGIPFAPDVDKPAIALPGNPSPRYPEILRRNNVKGEVVVQIVIDTTGLADMTTLRIISSDHPLLTDAVAAALPRARYVPAETGGRKVRMWAMQSFVFEVK